MTSTATQWDALTSDGRAKVVRRDRSMRRRQWSALVMAMSFRRFDQLTPVQQAAVRVLLPETA